MQQVRGDVSREALTEAIEANTYDACVRWGHTLGAALYEDAEVTYFTSEVPLQLSNGVIRARLPTDGTDARIAAIVAQLRVTGRPFAWQVGPSSRPNDLAARLEALGLTLDSVLPGMAIDLRMESLTALLPHDAAIVEVLDDGFMSRWIDVMCAASLHPDVVRDLLHALYARHGLSPNRELRFFLGLLDDMPVATSLLFLSAGVAGIYCVATLPDVRGRGFGTAMTAVPLRAAREAGFAIGILQSTPMGYSIYDRLGFAEYCRFRLYFGSPT